VGEASGRVGEHWGIAAELMDVQAASDDGQSRLSMWRPLVAAVQRGTDVDGAARRPLASEVVGARARSESTGWRRRTWRTWRQVFLAPLLHEALKPVYVEEGGGAHGAGAHALGRGGLAHRQ
jgi:hypothetical protein